MRSRGLIGRQAEEQRVVSAIQRGLDADAGVVLISGEPGVGKTALAEHCASRSGAQVRRGRCWEGSTSAFGPLAEAMRNALRADEGLGENLGFPSAELAPILPEMGPLPGEIDPDRVLWLLRGFWRAAGNKAATVILLEDLHWADAATLEILPRFAESLQSEPVAILLTHRSDAIGPAHPLRRARAELRAGGGVADIPLAPLGEAETATVLQALLDAPPSPVLTEAVHRRAQGFPFYIEELAAALVRSGQLIQSEEGLSLAQTKTLPLPDSIRDIVALRLGGLSPHAQATLEAAAVLGGEFSLTGLERLCEGELALEDLFDRGLLKEGPAGRAGFRHALTRAVVLDDIGWSRRRKLHRQAADLLEAEAAPAELVAEHLLAANDLPSARRWLIRAADHHCHVHAHRDAVDLAARALEIWPDGEDEETRLDVLWRMARCAQSSGLLREAARALNELLDSPVIAADENRRAEMLSALATVNELQEEWVDCVRLRRDAAETFERAGRLPSAVREWLQLSNRQLFSMDLREARASAGKAVALAKREGEHELIALSLATGASVEAVVGRTDEAKRMAEQALEVTLAHSLFKTAPEVYRVNAFIKEYTAEYADSLSTHQRVRNECAKTDQRQTSQLCLGCVSWILLRQGELRRSLEICQEILEDAEVPVHIQIVGHGVKAIILAERGEFRPAERHVHESQRLLNRAKADFLRIFPPYAAARIAEGERRFAAAAAHYDEVMACWHEIADWYGVMTSLPAAIIFWAEQDDERHLSEAGDVLSKIANDTRNPEAQATLALALGEITMRRGDFEVASRHLGQAAERFQRLNLPLEQMRSEMRRGLALQRLGESAKAIERLEATLAQARRMGIRLIAKQISDILGAAKAPGDDSDGSEGVGAELTPRQREVLALLGEGLTNKEIAARLHVSTRTVDMHMRHLFDRLNVRSRTEAIRQAAGSGLLK